MLRERHNCVGNCTHVNLFFRSYTHISHILANFIEIEIEIERDRNNEIVCIYPRHWDDT